MTEYKGVVTAYNGHPLYEGRPVGRASDPIGTASDFVFNAGYDAVDLFNGLGTMGSAVTARLQEGVPMPANNWQMKPWIRPQEDWNTGLQMGKAIVDNYAHSYVDPVMQGRPQDLASHFLAHPLNTLLDISGVGSLFQVPRLLTKAFNPAMASKIAGQVGKDVAEAAPVTAEAAAAEAVSGLGDVQEALAKKQAALEAAQAKTIADSKAQADKAARDVAMAKANATIEGSAQAQAKLDQALQAQATAEQALLDAQGSPSLLQTAIDEANKLKDKLLGRTEVNKQAEQMRREFAGGVGMEDNRFLDDVGKYWNAIPKKLRDQVQAYAEGWHPDLIAGKGVPDTIKAYLDKAEEYSAKMRERIGGQVSAADLELDKYQPAALKLNNIPADEWKALSRPEQLDILRFTRSQLKSKGIDAQYSPHVLPGEANSTIRNPGTMQGFVSKGLTKQDAGFLKTKQTAGDKAIKSHFDSMRTRWIQISQYQQAYEKILEKALEVGDLVDVLKNAPDAAANQVAQKAIKELQAQKDLAVKFAENAAKDAEKAQALAQKAADDLAEVEAALAKSKSDALKAKRDLLRKELEAAKAEAELTAKLEEQARKALDESLKDGTTLKQKMAAAGYDFIPGDQLVEAILGPLKGAVITEQDLAKIAEKLMPEGIFLPKEFTKAIENAMKNNTVSGNPLVRAYDKANTISKRYQLGGNFLTYGLSQGGQGAFMLELVSLNGPRSAITSILSYGLALNPKIRATVPLSIAEDVLASTVSTQRYLEQGVEALFAAPGLNKTPQWLQAPLRGSIAAYENVVDFGLKFGAVIDSMLRAKAGIQNALLLAQENTPLGKAITEMFDTTHAIKALETTFADDAQKMAVAKKVNDALGNFKEISEMPGMKAIGRVLPYPAWLGFITDYTIKLPINHPYKTLLLDNLAQLQQRYVADPNVPSHLKGNVGIDALGPNGNPQVISKEGMNPLTSVPQLLETLHTVMTGEGDDQAISLFTGPIQLGFMAITRLNPSTLKDFKDSNLVSVGDKQYKKSDVENMAILGGTANPVRPLPDPLTMALRTFIPVQERWLESFAEKYYSGGKRTAMSTLFYSAPKLDKRTGQVQKAPDWVTLMINNLINVTPVEYDPNAQALEMQKRMEEQKQAMRALQKMP